MKNPIFRLVALFFALLTSCHNDEPIQAPRVMERYLEQAGFTDVTDQIDVEDREFGIKFKPVVDGSIHLIVTSLPVAIPVYRITIWDADQQLILRSDSIKVSEVGPRINRDTKIMLPTSVNLTAGKEYMVTINSNDWYEYKGTSEAIYPFQVDNILITGFGYTVGTDLTFPTEFPTSYYAGNLDFSFKAD
jgi:hypothetical protein